MTQTAKASIRELSDSRVCLRAAQIRPGQLHSSPSTRAKTTGWETAPNAWISYR